MSKVTTLSFDQLIYWLKILLQSFPQNLDFISELCASIPTSNQFCQQFKFQKLTCLRTSSYYLFNPNQAFRAPNNSFRPMIEGSGEPHYMHYAQQLAQQQPTGEAGGGGNNNSSQFKSFKCNVCYMQQGLMMVQCGCFYCENCYLDAYNSNLEEQKCISCSKIMGQVFDMRKRDDLKRIASNIQNPHEIMQKVINAIKFQELHTKKYIAHLEKQLHQGRVQISNLKKDNQELRDQLNTHQKRANHRMMQGGPASIRPQIDAPSVSSVGGLGPYAVPSLPFQDAQRRGPQLGGKFGAPRPPLMRVHQQQNQFEVESNRLSNSSKQCPHLPLPQARRPLIPLQRPTADPHQICGILEEGNRSRMARANTPPPRQNLIEVNHHHFQRSSLTPDAKNSLSGGSGRGQYGSQVPSNSAPVDMAKMYQKRTYQDFYNQNQQSPPSNIMNSTTANSINRRPPPVLTSNNIATTPLYLPQSNPLQRKRLA